MVYARVSLVPYVLSNWGRTKLNTKGVERVCKGILGNVPQKVRLAQLTGVTVPQWIPFKLGEG